MELGEKDFPGLYQAADNASLGAQRLYLRALGLYIVLLIASPVLYFYSGNAPTGTIALAIVFGASLAISVFLKVKKFEDIWYNGRAVAESIKTRAWRWMMCAEPYVAAKNADEVSREFLADLREILAENRGLNHALAGESISDALSSRMCEIRALSVVDRIEIYKTLRVDDQRIWYGKKTLLNKASANFWFWVTVALHVIVIVFLLFRVQDASLDLPVGVFSTAASAVLTWVQSKKYGELASSYALAAHEITLIKGEGEAVKDQAQLNQYVLDSEAAFSREHTQWIARKRT